MTNFTKNKIKSKGNIEIHISDEPKNYGKENDEHSTEELIDEREPFAKEQMKKCAREILKKSLKFFIWLAIGLATLGYFFWFLWNSMGESLDLAYLFNITINFINIEAGNEFASALRLSIIFVIPALLVLFPSTLIIKKSKWNDPLFLHHYNTLNEIDFILKKRGAR